MASPEYQQTVPATEKEISGAPSSTTGADVNGGGLTAQQQRNFNYGGNPQYNAHAGGEARLAAFGGEFQPGLYRPTEHRKFANPAPLGLSAFALTTFVLSLVNLQTRGVAKPNIALSLAYGYGGLVQLLAGMWEMAVGNTFGATALSSYGGFWIAYAIILTPSFSVLAAYEEAPADEASVLGFFLTGWFIFTFILLLLTLRSTVMFFLLFFTLDLAFLFLATSEFAKSNGAAVAAVGLQKAGGVFGLFAAFLAWYNAFAGIADTSNSFFLIPVFHFPWSEKGREARVKTERETA
ncbi:putative gpr fun34 family protein [Rosellinia necatrix]|uniref:Putative gpr fun34 family protein n=1 Tax=Rosellinia necatrix TaxID=77044 RepID=A0A1W2TBY5_ROSNE|nr:putative gpr fun34 family protein [Rosellinia necatrix]